MSSLHDPECIPMHPYKWHLWFDSTKIVDFEHCDCMRVQFEWNVIIY